MFLLLALLLVAAGIMRYSGIFWGYPLELHPDEGAIVRPAIEMADGNTLLASGYDRPDNIGKKVSSVLYRLYAKVIYDVDWSQPVSALGEPIFFIISRLYVATLGLVTVWVVWRMLRGFGAVAGLVGSALFALYPLYVEHAHYATPDVPVTLAMCLTMLFALRYENKQSYANLALTVFWAALGTLDKYPSILNCGMIGLVIIACNWKNWRKLIIDCLFAGILYVALLFVISPNLFINWRDVWARIQVENRSSHLGADGLNWFGNMRYYIRQFTAAWGGAWALIVVPFLYGASVMVIKHKRKFLVFTAFIFWWVFLSTRALHWARWGFPMYAGALLIAAYGVGHLHKLLSRKHRGVSIALLSILSLAMLYHPLSHSIGAVAILNSDDTRNASMATAQEYGITLENALYDSVTPIRITSNPDVYWPRDTKLVDDQLYITKFGIDYIVESEQEGRYRSHPETYASILASYQWLHDHVEPFADYRATIRYDRSACTLLDSLRKLNVVIANGALSGSKVAFYDVRDLPVWIDIPASDFVDAQGQAISQLAPGEEASHITALRPGAYRMIFNRETKLQIQMTDGAGHVVPVASGDGEWQFTITKESPYEIIVKNPAQEMQQLDELSLIEIP
ncbi:MAG: ArnT family glycosyltransferase [Christensenellales bacterium]